VRVIRLYGPSHLRLAEEAAPEVATGETLVRVTDVGICGSDLHWFEHAGIGDARLTRPVVPGHEIAGTVEAGPMAGTPVALDPAIPDGLCPACLRGHRNLCPNVLFAGHGALDGGLRELMPWPTHLLHPLPPALTTTDGAVLEPLGVAIHAAGLGHLYPACSVAVVGCGPVGLLLLQVALASGATRAVAVEPLPHRRDEAARRCAAPALSPQEARERSRELEVDVVFEMAGTDDAVAQAMNLVRPGGRVVLGGIPDEDRTSFPASVARRKGVTIALVRRMTDDVYERGVRLVESGRVDVASLVTARFPLEKAQEAFESAVLRQGLKVVIQPSS
jgi:L-iditol 2-dehydrogenase